jgi:hypothetical protein
MTQAQQILSEATRLSEKCPHWYAISLNVGKGLSLNREDADRLFSEGQKLEPSYPPLNIQMSVYLFPQWHGEEGEWNSFLDKACDKVGGDEGDILFFDVAARAMKYGFLRQYPEYAGALWPRMKSGFFKTEAKYGLSNFRVNEGAYYAVFARDMGIAHRLFTYVGEDWNDNLWHTEGRFREWKLITANAVKNPSKS